MLGIFSSYQPPIYVWKGWVCGVSNPKGWVWRAVWIERFTYGSVRGLGVRVPFAYSTSFFSKFQSSFIYESKSFLFVQNAKLITIFTFHKSDFVFINSKLNINKKFDLSFRREFFHLSDERQIFGWIQFLTFCKCIVIDFLRSKKNRLLKSRF